MTHKTLNNDGILNFTINQENRVDNIIKKQKKQGDLLNHLGLDQV